MKYINYFDTKDAMDASKIHITHGEGPFVFDYKENNTPTPDYYDLQHWGSNCIKAKKINMTAKDKPTYYSPTHYSGDTSTVEDIVKGTYLYAKTSDNTLYYSNSVIEDSSYKAIGICVIKAVKENNETTTRWVSINFMDYSNPLDGSVNAVNMYWGNNNVTVDASLGKCTSTNYTYGRENTLKCLDMTLNDDVCALSKTVTNKYDSGYAPAALCCALYKTPGTEPGDWYLPSTGEAYALVSDANGLTNTSNSDKWGAINLARTKLKYNDTSYYGIYSYDSSSPDLWLWSSREYSSYNACNVYRNYNGDCYIDGNDKSYNYEVLSFFRTKIDGSL